MYTYVIFNSCTVVWQVCILLIVIGNVLKAVIDIMLHTLVYAFHLANLHKNTFNSI